MTDAAFEEKAEGFERRALLATQSCCGCKADLPQTSSPGHEQVWFAMKRGHLTHETIQDADAGIQLGFGPTVDAAMVEQWFQFKTAMCAACEKGLREDVKEAVGAIAKMRNASAMFWMKVFGIPALLFGLVFLAVYILKHEGVYDAPGVVIWLSALLAFCAGAIALLQVARLDHVEELDSRDLAMYPDADGRTRFYEAHKGAVTPRLSNLRKDTEFLESRVANSLSPLVFIKPGPPHHTDKVYTTVLDRTSLQKTVGGLEASGYQVFIDTN